MNKLRAPDPTLNALDDDASVWIEDSHPRVAHTMSTNPRCVKFSQWHEEAQYARWFSVPCRECFPDAPPPGHCQDRSRMTGRDGVRPDPGLTWQTR